MFRQFLERIARRLSAARPARRQPAPPDALPVQRIPSLDLVTTEAMAGEIARRCPASVVCIADHRGGMFVAYRGNAIACRYMSQRAVEEIDQLIARAMNVGSHES
jgi:hypothetical protein